MSIIENVCIIDSVIVWDMLWFGEWLDVINCEYVGWLNCFIVFYVIFSNGWLLLVVLMSTVIWYFG